VLRLDVIDKQFTDLSIVNSKMRCHKVKCQAGELAVDSHCWSQTEMSEGACKVGNGISRFLQGNIFILQCVGKTEEK
jgi:hypothetical protein